MAQTLGEFLQERIGSGKLIQEEKGFPGEQERFVISRHERPVAFSELDQLTREYYKTQGIDIGNGNEGGYEGGYNFKINNLDWCMTLSSDNNYPRRVMGTVTALHEEDSPSRQLLRKQQARIMSPMG